MKLFCISAVFVIAALTSWVQADMKEEMKAISKTCQDEVHVTTEELEQFYKNGMKPEDAKDAVKCHIKCMMEKQGHIKNGVFDEKEFLSSIQNIPHLKDHMAEITKAMSECKNEKGANDCDTAYKMVVCFKENKALLGIKGPKE